MSKSTSTKGSNDDILRIMVLRRRTCETLICKLIQTATEPEEERIGDKQVL
jgi:hypothetical protein